MRRALRRVIGRWPEYLAEIVVIMASILAAFALDNWNDGRSRKRAEVAILRSALSELSLDLADIDFNVRNHEQAVRSMDLLVETLEGDSSYHDSLAVHFHNALIMPRFVHSRSAFESMQSSGLDIVSNEELRRRLIRLYGAHYTNYQIAESELANEITHGLRSVMPGRFVQGFNYDQIGESYHGTLVPTNFEALKKDPEFLYYLRTLRNRTRVFVAFFYRGLRNDVTSSHDLIEKELGRLAQ